jgi:hypothetical protein
MRNMNIESLPIPESFKLNLCLIKKKINQGYVLDQSRLMNKLKMNSSFVKNCFPNLSMSINTTHYGAFFSNEILGKSMARDRDTISHRNLSKLGSLRAIEGKENLNLYCGKFAVDKIENLMGSRDGLSAIGKRDSEIYELRQNQTPKKSGLLSSLSISMVDAMPQKNIFSHETPVLRDLMVNFLYFNGKNNSFLESQRC